MVEISGEEANMLLYAFDYLYGVDKQGRVQGSIGQQGHTENPFPLRHPVWGFRQSELQTLRDKLFGGWLEWIK